MKFETNNKLLSGEATSDSNDEQTEHRANAAELIDDILSEFMDGRPVTYNNINIASNAPQAAATPSLLDMLMTPRPSAESDNVLMDEIDPSSDLGTSLRNKFTELEAISQRLKTRLGQVVDDALSQDADDDSLEAELERDLDTDCSEDLSLQEFLQLLKAQNKDIDSSTQNVTE